MNSAIGFEEILKSKMKETDALADRLGRENAQPPSQVALPLFHEWWHRVPETEKKSSTRPSKTDFRHPYATISSTSTKWKPQNLPLDVTEAYLFFHRNDFEMLTDKSPTHAVRKAYRLLAKRLHPDLGAQNETAPFRELQRHYQTLLKFTADRSFGT